MTPSASSNNPAQQSIIPEVASVYRVFVKLSALAADRFSGEIGGKLLLYRQLDAEGAAVALGANIAGAATLGVDGDAERLKQGIRHGYCDFMVNNLDEALRILKNEIRKKQPVSVCLEGDFASILHEMAARGVQPDLLAAPAAMGETANLAMLAARGAIPVDEWPSPGGEQVEVRWTVASAPALWLPKVDALAASLLPADDVRLRWLRFAPRYLGRSMAGPRYLKMAGGEAERFAALVAEAAASGALGTEVKVLR